MEILIKSLIISLAIVGLRIVSSPGMFLYFLRMPYEILVNVNKRFNKRVPKDKAELWVGQFIGLILLRMPVYLLKPIIGCTTCMASVWTIVIDYTYFELNKYTILTAFIVAALNSLIYALYVKLDK